MTCDRQHDVMMTFFRQESAKDPCPPQVYCRPLAPPIAGSRHNAAANGWHQARGFGVCPLRPTTMG